MVWGPPGSGKTHFSALALLLLLQAHRRLGRSFRVMVTASTNTAVDNVLAKLEKLRGQLGLAEGVPICKLDWKLQRGAAGGSARPFDVQLQRNAAALVEDNECVVVGATVWRLHKHVWRKRREVAQQQRTAGYDERCFDLLLVDEGSQMRLVDAALAVALLRTEGRLVVVGDVKQLPPIWASEYPQHDPERPTLGSSLLGYLQVASQPLGQPARPRSLSASPLVEPSSFAQLMVD